jgi:hypothetical protein
MNHKYNKCHKLLAHCEWNTGLKCRLTFGRDPVRIHIRDYLDVYNGTNCEQLRAFFSDLMTLVS